MSDIKGRVLIIEDEGGLCMALEDRLAAEGYECRSVQDGTKGFAEALSGRYDLVLLDVMLPGMDGFSVCKALREKGLRVPTLMMSAKSQVEDRVAGLKLGADDYLCKPFELAELAARVEALIRRAGEAGGRARPVAEESPGGVADFGDFSLDFDQATVTRAGAVEALSGQEFKLLSYLVRHPDRILGRELLLDEVWGYGADVSSRTVDVHVAWLRQKIGDTGPLQRHILTVRGLGYRFLP